MQQIVHWIGKKNRNKQTNKQTGSWGTKLRHSDTYCKFEDIPNRLRSIKFVRYSAGIDAMSHQSRLSRSKRSNIKERLIGWQWLRGARQDRCFLSTIERIYEFHKTLRTQTNVRTAFIKRVVQFCVSRQCPYKDNDLFKETERDEQRKKVRGEDLYDTQCNMYISP